MNTSRKEWLPANRGVAARWSRERGPFPFMARRATIISLGFELSAGHFTLTP